MKSRWKQSGIHISWLQIIPKWPKVYSKYDSKEPKTTLPPMFFFTQLQKNQQITHFHQKMNFQGTNLSHLGKRKNPSSNMPWGGRIWLVPCRASILNVRCTPFQLTSFNRWSTQKTLILSMKSWLFTRDPYNGSVKSTHITRVGVHPQQIP